MKKSKKRSANRKASRRNERGAALIMMMLIAMLLLAAGGALIMSTALSTGSVYEATPETQAYYAAEAGLEDVLTVLRGNIAPLNAGVVAPSPSSSVLASVSTFASSAYSAFMPTASAAKPAPTPTPGGGGGTGGTTGTIPDSNKIDLRRALDHEYADHPDDPESAPDLRLSRWLDYDYTPPNGEYADRVTLSDNYSPLTGTAYRIKLRDPDDSTSVGLTTTGLFKSASPAGIVSANGQAITFNNVLGAAVGTATITYVPRPNGVATPSYPQSATNLGSFSISSTGIGATIPPGITFNLNINQTAPWQGSVPLTATLSGLINPVALLNSLQVGFLTDSLNIDGTKIKLTNLVGRLLSLLVPPAGGSVPIQATIIAPEPKRVIVQSTGLGPKGAQKILEMLITRANFDFEAPATLTLRGANDCSAPSFSTGSSNAKNYTGKDVDKADLQRPAFAVTDCDYNDAVAGTSKPGTVEGDPQIGILNNGTAAGSMTTAPVSTPGFLETADKARQYLSELEATARSQGRYFNPGSGSSITVNYGTPTDPVFTFVDGDCNLDGGAGLLVVTGNLNMSGNPSFDGVVMVLGGGNVNRNGGGNGTFSGSMVVAKFARTWPASENNVEHPFL
ncbi:MAG TPA: hypothetical protein VGO96_19090, partial [Pyrinomonadaceae bacterium]|nr:hypothetical protein [Pyrinomonadaceae bacterium]